MTSDIKNSPAPHQLCPLVISGPSGTGKSTILNRLFATHPHTFGFSVSHTTRTPRAGETNGKEYHFVSRAAFEALRDSGGFIEWAQFGGNLYGTSLAAVEDVAHSGRRCVLDIEMEGVKQVKGGPLNARVLFLRPPNVEALEKRLRGRGSEDEEAIRKRLEQAKLELAYQDEVLKMEGNEDSVVVNDDLAKAYEEVEAWALEG